jgi:hypothetical protein
MQAGTTMELTFDSLNSSSPRSGRTPIMLNYKGFGESWSR